MLCPPLPIHDIYAPFSRCSGSLLLFDARDAVAATQAANLSFEFEGVMRKQSTRKVCCKTVTVRLTGQQAEPVRATHRVLLEALSIHLFESLLS